MSPKALDLITVFVAIAVYVGVSYAPGDMSYVREICTLVIGGAGFSRFQDRK